MSPCKRSTSMAAAEVEGSDDMLTEILARLPKKSYFSCKTVSKRWNNILFCTYLLEPHIANKLNDWLCGNDDYYHRISFIIEHCIVTFRFYEYANSCRTNPVTPLFMSGLGSHMHKDYLRAWGDIIHSSNGLILSVREAKTYYVTNPLTNKSTAIPPPPIMYKDPIVSLVCEIIVNYKIILAPSLTSDFIIPIQTYSSKTGKWSTSKLVSSALFSLPKHDIHPLVCNGVVHWFSNSWTLVLYDSLREHLDENHVQLIHLPQGPWVPNGSWSFTRTCIDNVLWFCVTDDERIRLWKLPKGKHGSYMRSSTILSHEWNLAYEIKWEQGNFVGSSSLKLQALVRWDSRFGQFGVVLMNEHGIYVCNLEINSLMIVEYCGVGHGSRSYITEGIKYYPYYKDYPFLASYVLQ